MHRFNHLKSVRHLVAVALFTSAGGGGDSERCIYPNIPFRSFALSDSSRPRIDSPPPATTRIDDFVHVEDTPPVNENVISERKTSYQRKILPPELKHNRNVVTLTCKSTADGGICDVYLVGTCHFSSKSCERVRAVISFLKPQVVFLELCDDRLAILLDEVGSKHEVVYGGEFCVAYEEAMKYGAKVIPGDRSQEITLRRMWAKMPLWQKTLFVPGFLLVLSFIAIIPYSETLTKMVTETDENEDRANYVLLEKKYPIVYEAIVHERDKYMSATLLEVAPQAGSCGTGPLSRIRKNWGQPVDVKLLLEMPSVKHPIPVGKIVAGVAIVYGLYLYINK